MPMIIRFSYICFNPIATIKVENETIFQTFPDGSETSNPITKTTDVSEEINQFTKRFKVNSEEEFQVYK